MAKRPSQTIKSEFKSPPPRVEQLRHALKRDGLNEHRASPARGRFALIARAHRAVGATIHDRRRGRARMRRAASKAVRDGRRDVHEYDVRGTRTPRRCGHRRRRCGSPRRCACAGSRATWPGFMRLSSTRSRRGARGGAAVDIDDRVDVKPPPRLPMSRSGCEVRVDAGVSIGGKGSQSLARSSASKTLIGNTRYQEQCQEQGWHQE